MRRTTVHWMRDKNGLIIGSIREDGETGNQTLITQDGRILGIYKPKFDMTFDNFGKVIGRGNLLALLLSKK